MRSWGTLVLSRSYLNSTLSLTSSSRDLAYSCHEIERHLADDPWRCMHVKRVCTTGSPEGDHQCDLLSRQILQDRAVALGNWENHSCNRALPQLMGRGLNMFVNARWTTQTVMMQLLRRTRVSGLCVMGMKRASWSSLKKSSHLHIDSKESCSILRWAMYSEWSGAKKRIARQGTHTEGIY